MAIREFWLGSVGPLYYDDAATYPDGTPQAGIYAERLKVSTPPVDPEDVPRLSDIPASPPSPSDTVSDETSFGIDPDAGMSSTYSRSDHTHGTPAVPSASDVGLGNVPNVDCTDPGNIVEDSTHRFTTDAEKSSWNGKQDALGFTPAHEVGANDIEITDSTKGIILKDTVTGTRYRIKITSGVLGIAAV